MKESIALHTAPYYQTPVYLPGSITHHSATHMQSFRHSELNEFFSKPDFHSCLFSFLSSSYSLFSSFSFFFLPRFSYSHSLPTPISSSPSSLLLCPSFFIFLTLSMTLPDTSPHTMLEVLLLFYSPWHLP